MGQMRIAIKTSSSAIRHPTLATDITTSALQKASSLRLA